jgi:hypothetical protein
MARFLIAKENKNFKLIKLIVKNQANRGDFLLNRNFSDDGGDSYGLFITKKIHPSVLAGVDNHFSESTVKLPTG